MRGPQPQQLSRLYALSQQGIRNPKELAEKLGVKKETVYVYRWRLKKRLQKLVKNSLQDYNGDPQVCPECLDDTLCEDVARGEWVCRRCGLVTKQVQKFSNDLPWDTTYALTSNIAFGKSLGDTLSYRGLYRVLAKTRSKGDQPVPIRQIQAIVKTVDPPVIRSMLNYGSVLLKRLGLDRDTEFNHAFADRYGRLLRKIGAFLQATGSKVPGYLVARAALGHLLEEEAKFEKAAVVRERFPFKLKHLRIARGLHVLEKDL